jgi:chorismate mutase
MYGHEHSRWHDLLDPILSQELCQASDLLQVSLGVGDTHDAVHPVDTISELAADTGFTGMVPSVLGP